MYRLERRVLNIDIRFKSSLCKKFRKIQNYSSWVTKERITVQVSITVQYCAGEDDIAIVNFAIAGSVL